MTDANNQVLWSHGERWGAGGSLYKLVYMESDSKDWRPETGRRQGVMGANCKGRGRKTQYEDRNEVYVDRQ